MEDKLFGALGICRKAGKLLLGFDPVAEGIRDGGVRLVLLAQDLSEKSAKEMRFICQKHHIAIEEIPFTMDEIWTRQGRRSGILGLTDTGLAKVVETALRRLNEEE